MPCDTFNSPAAGETYYKTFIVCLTKTSCNTIRNKLTGQISNRQTHLSIKYRGSLRRRTPLNFHARHPSPTQLHLPPTTITSNNHHAIIRNVFTTKKAPTCRRERNQPSSLAAETDSRSRNEASIGASAQRHTCAEGGEKRGKGRRSEI